MSEIRIADLFAGIGGIRMGMVQALGDAAHVVYSSEWNKYSVQTYEANWHDENPVAGDITKVDEHDVPDIDLLLAGFPCQPFSIAGVSKKQSMGRPTGFEDKTQGTLFFDVARIIKAKQPKAFLLENVKNLLSLIRPWAHVQDDIFRADRRPWIPRHLQADRRGGLRPPAQGTHVHRGLPRGERVHVR